MTDENRKAVEKFISICDELITCKFLVAENKIQKLLASLAETPAVYELVSECMEQFNRDREMSKAFVQESKGNFVCHMPNEEFKIISLVFCTLADINAGRIIFMDFVKTYFNDEDGLNCFKRFIAVMIIPFRNLIAEAFNYPIIDLNKSEKQEEIASDDTNIQGKEKHFFDDTLADKLVQFPTVKNSGHNLSQAKLEKLCEVCQRITVQILDELEGYLRRDSHIDDLKSICYALVMTTSDLDFDETRALALGLKYASKGVKSIKFLVRELEENLDEFLSTLVDLK